MADQTDGEEFLLMDPGPTKITRTAREAGAEPMVSHRSPEFEAAHETCQRGAALAFGTDAEPVLINGNGWMGVETAMAGVLRADDTVLTVQTGKFGRENGDIAARYVDEVRRVEGEWGTPVDLDAVDDALDEDVDAITMTHCETSTGMINPVPEMGALAEEYGALLFVDGVSSIGGVRLGMDEHGVDVAMTSSQKALGGPPGVSPVALSEPARERVSDDGGPYTLNLATYLEYLDRNQTPSTAPVTVYRALAASLESLLEAGLDARLARTRRLAEAVRAGADALGLEPVAEPNEHSSLSNTVQALALPDGVAEADVLDGLAARNVSVRGGLGRLEGEALRIATMGAAIDGDDVVRTVGALGGALRDAGHEPAASPETAREAARERLSVEAAAD